jgi:hypothetical protein
VLLNRVSSTLTWLLLTLPPSAVCSDLAFCAGAANTDLFNI